MLMFEFIPFDQKIHKDEYIQMNIEYLTKNLDDLAENYLIDSRAMVGMTAQEMAHGILEAYKDLKPPQGILLILTVEGETAGMGALKKLGQSVGEIKSMYIRPRYRGKGCARALK